MTKPKIYIAGHTGLVGSSIAKYLKTNNESILTRERKELDLLNQSEVLNFFKNNKIDQVYLALQKLVVFSQIILIPQNLFMKI